MENRVGMTAKLVMIVACAIVMTTAAMWMTASRQVWLDLQRQDQERAQQNSRTLALIFAGRVPGAKATVEGGQVTAVTAPALTDFADASVVDEAVAYVGGSATVFAYDPAKDAFIRRVTTVRRENGERAIGTAMAADSPAQGPCAAARRFAARYRSLAGPSRRTISRSATPGAASTASSMSGYRSRTPTRPTRRRCAPSPSRP